MQVVVLDDARVERLVPRIVAELQLRGTAVATVEHLDLERWRRAARLAGRQLGWRVRTGVNDGRAWVTSEDYEPPAGSDRSAADLFVATVSAARPLARIMPMRRPAAVR